MPRGPTHGTCAVRVPASGVPYVPHTVAPQVARSFDTWAANHKKIYFTDVTDLCAGATDNECAAAEVYIYPDREFSAANDLAAPLPF